MEPFLFIYKNYVKFYNSAVTTKVSDEFQTRKSSLKTKKLEKNKLTKDP